MKNKTSPTSIFKNPLHFIAFGFGSGLLPKAPGTFGTLVAIPFYLLLQDFSLVTYVLIIVAATFFGVWICDITSKDLNVPDHPGIVWDEIVGYLVTMLISPPGSWWIAVGFVTFRFFDVLKPWPIRSIERRVSGGLGIMLDDILAALYSWLIIGSIIYLFH